MPEICVKDFQGGSLPDRRARWGNRGHSGVGYNSLRQTFRCEEKNEPIAYSCTELVKEKIEHSRKTLNLPFMAFWYVPYK